VIRTHERSRRAAVDLRLRPRGHWDRYLPYVFLKIYIGACVRVLYSYVSRCRCVDTTEFSLSLSLYLTLCFIIHFAINTSVGAVNYTPASIYPQGMRPGYPLDRKLRPLSRFGCHAEGTIPIARELNPDPADPQHTNYSD
jgi:hypothetical protein